MACVEPAIPIPNPRKKTDELFLSWLSEPSTQQLLRKELMKISGVPFSDTDENGVNHKEGSLSQELLSPSSTLTSVLRPGSPISIRTPSPPHGHPSSSRSPKSPRNSVVVGKSNRSPKKSLNRTANGISGGKMKPLNNSLQLGFEEVDGVENMIGGGHVPLIDSTNFMDGPSTRNNRDRRSRSHSPKPEALPTGHGLNHIVFKPDPPIPRFYFPNGKPQPEENMQQMFAELTKVFESFEMGEASLKQFGEVTKALHIPYYWKAPLFRACVGKEKTKETVSIGMVKKTWQRVTQNCHDSASRFVRLLAPKGRNYLLEEDLEPLIQDIVDTHPGLQFLHSTPEFHARYVETVIGRIFYIVDRNWNGRLTAAEIRRSNFLQTLSLLEEVDDLNQVTDFFSYEHFYVIYCKFWELDTDHDLEIDCQDLMRHGDFALTQRIINRIISGVVTRRCGGAQQKEGKPPKMSYKDFIWFLLSEEDKTSPRSIEYWFRCMDLDGDGVLSLFELVYFYEEVLQRLLDLDIDCLSVENTVCQILDMVNPKEKGKITLRDLKACKLTPVFFNTFVNVEKYLDYEQRDPMSCLKEDGSEGVEISPWDKYASEQYILLVQEEQYEQEIEEDNNCDSESSDLEDDEKDILDFL